VTEVTVTDGLSVINGTTTPVISLVPSKGLSVFSEGLSVQLSTGLDFDSSNNNGLIFNPPHARMFLSGTSQTQTFNSGETIWFSGVSPTTNDSYLNGTSSFHPPVNGYYNSSVHLFNGALSATSASVIALQDDTTNVLQRFQTYGLDDISFSGIHEFTQGTSYSLKVESGPGVSLVLGKGYSEWSVNYIAKS
jgi:hypothetical protein